MFRRKQVVPEGVRVDYTSERYYEIRKGTEWDFKKAEGLPYSLYNGYKITRADGTSYTHGWAGGYTNGLDYVASGDKAWAERTAKHFNIKMPE